MVVVVVVVVDIQSGTRGRKDNAKARLAGIVEDSLNSATVISSGGSTIRCKHSGVGLARFAR